MEEAAPMRYQAIIFDVSDTLVRYSPNYAQIYSDRLRHLGFAIGDQMPSALSKAVNWAIGAQVSREQAGAPHMADHEHSRMLDAAALACLNPAPQGVEPLLDRLAQIPLPTQRMQVIDGVLPMLDALQGRGYRLAIVSNHYACLLDFLRRQGLAPYFDPIIISALVGVEKPNVRIMQLALEALELPAERCLYVGDHPLDVLCAKGAGMGMAWIAPTDEALPAEVPCREDYRVASAVEVANLACL